MLPQKINSGVCWGGEIWERHTGAVAAAYVPPWSWSQCRARQPRGTLPTLPCLCPRLEGITEVRGQPAVPQKTVCAAQFFLLLISDDTQSCWGVCSQLTNQDTGLGVPSSGIWSDCRGKGECEGGEQLKDELAARWISLGWAVAEFCMAALCISWEISLAFFFKLN